MSEEIYTDATLEDFIDRVNNIQPDEIITVTVEIENDRAVVRT